MAKLIFRLFDVSEDEADDIRTLLTEHNLAFYETQEGRWRVGLAAIWITDNERFNEARALIDAYQIERYQRLQQEPPIKSLYQQTLDHPIRFLATVLLLSLILAISVLPFLHL